MESKKKFLNTLYQFESSVPRRGYFSAVPPAKWDFQSYCANRLQQENTLTSQTLKRDYITDLQWLQSPNQVMPRQLKQYVKSLENDIPETVVSQQSNRQIIFENTVTAYSQAVSDTIQAEVQQFSSGDSNFQTPSSSSAVLTYSPSLIEHSPSSENSSPKSTKRTRCTIQNYLADNESEIMAFGAVGKYIVNGIDVVHEFKEFKQDSIEYIKKATYFDLTYDIHKMLALSNIMLIDKTTNSKQLPQIVSKETYRSIKQDFINRHMRSVKFSDKLYKRVKRIFDKYFIYATNDESEDEIRSRNNESRIALLKLAQKANIYENAAIEVIVNLIPVLTNNNLNRVSELHLTSSYIHNVVNSMFGSANVIAHCSNLLPCETTESGSKERPDYVCDKYKNREYDYSTIFGEIKSETNTNDLNHDLYRLAFFAKNATETYNLGNCLSFQAIGTTVHFYCMTLKHQSCHVLMDIATIKIPTQRADFRDILLNLDTIVQLVKLHDIFCVPVDATVLYSPSASYELFEQKLKQAKQTKTN